MFALCSASAEGSAPTARAMNVEPAAPAALCTAARPGLRLQLRCSCAYVRTYVYLRLRSFFDALSAIAIALPLRKVTLLQLQTSQTQTSVLPATQIARDAA